MKRIRETYVDSAPVRCPVCGSDDTVQRQKLQMPHGYRWFLICWTCRAWSKWS
jgi:C4-type Zn-finger protein